MKLAMFIDIPAQTLIVVQAQNLGMFIDVPAQR
jgi:hypothetical protein